MRCVPHTQVGAIASDKSCLISSSWYRRGKEGHLHKGKCMPCLQAEKSLLSFSCICRVSVAFSSKQSFHKVAYFGVAHSDPLDNFVIVSSIPFTKEETSSRGVLLGRWGRAGPGLAVPCLAVAILVTIETISLFIQPVACPHLQSRAHHHTGNPYQVLPLPSWRLPTRPPWRPGLEVCPFPLPAVRL